MMIRTIKTSVGAFDDGSGYAADLELKSDTGISIKQGSDHVALSREQWGEMRDAIDKMYDALDDLVRPRR